MISQQPPFYQRLAYILISIVIIIYGLYVLKDLLVPLTFAGLLAIMLLPVCNKLEKWGFPRWLAILVAIILVVGILILLGYLAYTQIISFQEVLPQLYQKAEVYYKKIQTLVYENFGIRRRVQVSEGQKLLTEWAKNNGSILTNTLSVTTSFLGNLALIPLYMFLFLLYRDFIKVFFYKVFKGVSHFRVNSILGKIKEVVLNYLIGLITVIAIVGTLNTIGLVLLGIDNAIFFGFLASFLVLIPYIGIAIGALLPILYALITKDSPLTALGVAGIFFGVQFLEGNFITPYVVGSKVSMNSMAAIIALLIFGNLWGLGGLVLALPITAIVKVIFDSIDGLKPFGFLIGDADNYSVKNHQRKQQKRNSDQQA